MRIIVIYPCDSKRKSQYQQTFGTCNIKSIKNASILFSEDYQEWIKEFKEKIRKIGIVEDESNILIL